MYKNLLKQNGGALVGVLLVILVIAAIYFGSSFFFQGEKSPIEEKMDILDKAQSDLGKVNEKINETNEEITEISDDSVDSGATETASSSSECEEDAGICLTPVVKEKTEIHLADIENGQLLTREDENFEINFNKNWYYTVNRREAIQDGYDMILGFGEDEDIWEMLPPFTIELVIANENMEWKYDGYVKELGVKDGKKYSLRTGDKEKYQASVDAMADTFNFIN